jgi:hypothetical protein
MGSPNLSEGLVALTTAGYRFEKNDEETREHAAFDKHGTRDILNGLPSLYYQLNGMEPVTISKAAF